MNDLIFRDRRDAGRRLAAHLEGYPSDTLVLGLPRGGVPVAYQVARELHAELDVLVVRKLGVPGRPEFAMGAIAGGGVEVVDRDLAAGIGVSDAQIEAVIREERTELERRERSYRGDRPPHRVRGRTVIVVDDGLATGASMTAALQLLREQEPARLVVAVPVGPPDVDAALRGLADEVVCVLRPRAFRAVGQHYQNFGQTSDVEVSELLERMQAEEEGR